MGVIINRSEGVPPQAGVREEGEPGFKRACLCLVISTVIGISTEVRHTLPSGHGVPLGFILPPILLVLCPRHRGPTCRLDFLSGLYVCTEVIVSRSEERMQPADVRAAETRLL